MSKTGLELSKLTTEDSLPTLKSQGEVVEFLNRKPADDWLDEHPTNKKIKVMPIGRVEWLLTNIFQDWYVEVLNTKAIFNSLVCEVRVFYKDPVTQEYKHQDGVGAAPMKTDSGSKASDMSAIKSDGVQTGLPAAKSFAIKDACDHIGRIFGRDINRSGVYGYTNPYAEDETTKVLDMLRDATTADELDNIFNTIPADKQPAYQQVVENRLKEIQDASNGR